MKFHRNTIWLVPLLLITTYPLWSTPVGNFLTPRGGFDPALKNRKSDSQNFNLDTVKIGYEISFNKYFYRHKPLRSLEEVATDIINLEQKAEGLIAQILGVNVAEVQGEA